MASHRFILRTFGVKCKYTHAVCAFTIQFYPVQHSRFGGGSVLFVFPSSVPNRYTFTCPYCNCPNLDQDGLIEHCTSVHARDARQVVGNPLSTSPPGGAHILNLMCIPGVSHLCLDALGGPWIQECRLFPALEDQAHILIWYFCCK